MYSAAFYLLGRAFLSHLQTATACLWRAKILFREEETVKTGGAYWWELLSFGGMSNIL